MEKLRIYYHAELSYPLSRNENVQYIKLYVTNLFTKHHSKHTHTTTLLYFVSFLAIACEILMSPCALSSRS